MQTKDCQQCGDPIPNRWPNGDVKVPSIYAKLNHCSQRCANSRHRQPLPKRKECLQCGEPIRRHREDGSRKAPSHYRQQRYCSYQCVADSRRGTWQRRSDGYVTRRNGGKHEAQHRHIMEQYLGRALLPGESVHHLNGVRDDNRIENLELWVRHQPSGQRVTDLVAWAKVVLAVYCDDDGRLLPLFRR